ncbi:MAG: nitrite reductase small subunit NirD [Robiginitomaculum sp.]|nr:nitrite reductase small subunit NirD [Gammaproteobacteria bacterium]MBL4871760.1 nitrite reductase small subunit NirD [Robiginitomaculum sp.]
MNQTKYVSSESRKTAYICSKEDLIANSGICVLFGDAQIAVFYLPEENPSVYGISNWDPIGKANVLSRGIVGDIGNELVVASPLYKQHFSLIHGQCLEQEELAVRTFELVLDGEDVLLLC